MIKLTFSDGSQVACEELTDSFSMVQTYYQNLSPVTDSVKAELVFSVALANKIKSFGDDDIIAEVWIGEDKVFTGFLRKTFNFIKTQRNQPIPVEIVSPAIKLDADLDEKVVLINKTVNEIILFLGQKLDMTLNCPINKIITCFVAESGDNIGNIIKELLFENGYTYSFNSNGVFTVIPLFNAPSEVTQVFNGDNCLNEIKIQKKEVATKGVSLKWASVEYIADTLIFDETEGRTEQKLCSVKIPPASYMYGSDRESNNEDGIHYLEYDSTLGKVLHVTSARREERGSLLGVVSKRFENLGTRALWQAYNNSYITSSEYTKFRIYGNAYIQTSVNVTKSTEGTEKLKEYNIQYLSDSDSVEALSLKLVDYYKYATFTLTIQSKSDYEPGTFVYITDYGIGSYTGRILQKTTNGRGFKVYIVESVLPYTPASVAATQRTRTSGAGAIGERGQTGASAYNYIGIINDSSEVPESDNGDFFLCGQNFFMDRGLLTTDKGLLKLSGKFLRLKSRFEKGFIYYADANGKWNKVEDKNNFRYSVAINDLFFVTGQASPIFEENTVGKVYEETGLNVLENKQIINKETRQFDTDLLTASDIRLREKGIIHSQNYNGTINSEGKITSYGTSGWAIDFDGKSDFTKINATDITLTNAVVYRGLRNGTYFTCTNFESFKTRFLSHFADIQDFEFEHPVYFCTGLIYISYGGYHVRFIPTSMAPTFRGTTEKYLERVDFNGIGFGYKYDGADSEQIEMFFSLGFIDLNLTNSKFFLSGFGERAKQSSPGSSPQIYVNSKDYPGCEIYGYVNL